MQPKDLWGLSKKLPQFLKLPKLKLQYTYMEIMKKNFLQYKKFIKKEDWIFSSWRSDYHCLLKGVPPEKLKKDII